jgi:hypothetical protein
MRPQDNLQLIDFTGDPARTRTQNLLIKSYLRIDFILDRTDS